MDSTDEQVMGRVQAGEHEALHDLFQRYKVRIFHFCLGMLRNRADAEEASGDVFLALVIDSRAFDPTRRFSTWLFAIARNKCVSRLRKRARLLPLWSRDDDEEDVGADVPDLSDPAWQHVARQELAARIRKAINLLPVDQRTALILRQYHGFTYEEVADIMRCSLANVKVLLFRAKDRLRVHLAAVIQEERS